MKLLISQTASIGDVILSTPVILSLRRNYPDAELWFLSTSAGAQLLKSNKNLSGVIAYDKNGKDQGLLGLLRKSNEIRKQRFDVVFAIQRSARVSILLKLSGIAKRIGYASSVLPFLFTKTVVRVKGVHDVERNLSILSGEVQVDDADKELNLNSPDADSITREIKELVESGPYVCVFPGSLWFTKRWDPQNFADLGKVLSQKGERVFFVGSKDEKQLVDGCANQSKSLSLAGKTTLQDLIYLVANSKAVVCNDSSSLHIASAFKIPTVSVFCATSPQMGFGPWRNPKCEIVEEKDLWCKPCARHGGTFCPTGTHACMKGSINGASVERVVAALEKVLA